jgi:hypothetical protein
MLTYAGTRYGAIVFARAHTHTFLVRLRSLAKCPSWCDGGASGSAGAVGSGGLRGEGRRGCSAGEALGEGVGAYVVLSLLALLVQKYKY